MFYFIIRPVADYSVLQDCWDKQTVTEVTREKN